ncbi:MAG: ISKra4 family transposase, partial [Streptosporangiaceae bacterium]
VLPAALRPATAKAAAARAKQAAASGWPDDPGELRKSRKRMAELAAVADIPPAPRTPGDILGALFGPAGQGGPAHPGPKAQGKTMFASVRKPAGEVIAGAFAEAHHRDPDHRRPWFAVVDGNNHQIETITALATDYQVTVPILIDLIHVTGYLWKAANSFFYPGEPDARAWVREQTAKILAGKHHDVRAGIRRRATTCGYSPAERAGADECASYLEHKQDYLDYPAFLAAGWPVASGLIEGAARWIVKDRMEVTGARWGLDSAEAVLRLRALHGTGDLDDYLDFHFQQEKRRNHDNRYQQSQELAA